MFAEEGVSYEINEEFYDDFDAWDGKNPNKTFVIGNTSNVLQSIGMKQQSIKMHSGMIISKQNKHPEMKREYFRQIPELLENPVIVQFSDAIDPETKKSKYNSRITVLGELYAEINGEQEPVLVSLELLPEKKLKIRDFAIITSAYGHSRLNNYSKENSILYIDPNKKRTNSWLSRTRLQLPVGENQRDSIRSIAYAEGKVKIQNPIHMTQMQEKLYKAGVIDEYGNTIADSGKFSKDDTIIDPDELDEELLFTSDCDLSFDGYGTSAGKVINVEQLMQEQGAEQAIYTLYNAADNAVM